MKHYYKSIEDLKKSEDYKELKKGLNTMWFPLATIYSNTVEECPESYNFSRAILRKCKEFKIPNQISKELLKFYDIDFDDIENKAKLLAISDFLESIYTINIYKLFEKVREINDNQYDEVLSPFLERRTQWVTQTYRELSEETGGSK